MQNEGHSHGEESRFDGDYCCDREKTVNLSAPVKTLRGGKVGERERRGCVRGGREKECDPYDGNRDDAGRTFPSTLQ